MPKVKKVLRVNEVAAKLGVSRPTVYRLRKKPGFPKKIKLGPCSSGFLESEIDEWIESRKED